MNNRKRARLNGRIIGFGLLLALGAFGNAPAAFAAEVTMDAIFSGNIQKWRRLQVDEFLNTEASLVDDGAKGPFRDVSARMVGYDRTSMAGWIVPDLMAAFGMPVENKTGPAEFMNDCGRLKRWQMAHRSTGTGIFISILKCGF